MSISHTGPHLSMTCKSCAELLWKLACFCDGSDMCIGALVSCVACDVQTLEDIAFFDFFFLTAKMFLSIQRLVACTILKLFHFIVYQC